MISTILAAATNGFTGAEADALPIVAIALVVDAAIVGAWYMLGAILKNSKITQSALGEFYQFIGTAIMAVVLIWGMLSVSGLFGTVAGSTKLMSPTAMSALCTQIEQTTNLDILRGSNSLLAGAQTQSGGGLVGICQILQGSSATDKIDYPLASAAVIIANETNQTAANLNAAYTFDAFIGYLSQLAPYVAVCVTSDLQVEECALPVLQQSTGGASAAADAAVTSLEVDVIQTAFSYTPYSGYRMLYISLGALGSMLNLSMETFVAQMIVVSMMLYVWPWLIFGGLVLRSTFLTRRIGGLLIAFAVGVVIIFPTVYAIEYLSLANGMPSVSGLLALATPMSANQVYGFNSITSLQNNMGSSTPANNAYALNFFIQPSLYRTIQNDGCWPTGGLITAEAADTASLLVPGYTVIAAIYQLTSGALTGGANPNFPLPDGCQPANALNTTFQLMEAYGIIGVTSYFIPIINLIITMTSIIGLSGLMGGDTSLEGLGKFL
jgi:hypothetical protein